jgi:hypothetical protein
MLMVSALPAKGPGAGKTSVDHSNPKIFLAKSE